MARFLYYSAGALTLVTILGCGGGSSATTPDPSGDTLDRQSAVILASDMASIDVSADAALAPAMMDEVAGPLGGKSPRFGDRERPLGIDDDCAVVVGSPREGGSVTYTNCETPRGRLSGIITWTAGENAWSSTKNLTFTRSEDSSTFTLVGESAWTRTENADGSITIHRTGESTGTGATKRVENDSDMTWTRTPAIRERSYPTGTQSTQVFASDVLVHDVLLTFNGTSTVTAVVDGETYTYNIGDRNRPRPSHKPRPRGGVPGRR